MKTTGDGVLARFDGPARAVSCGLSTSDAAPELGLAVRAGVRGEHELKGVPDRWQVYAASRTGVTAA